MFRPILHIEVNTKVFVRLRPTAETIRGKELRTLLATPYSFAPTTILMNSRGFGSGEGSVTVSPQA